MIALANNLPDVCISEVIIQIYGKKKTGNIFI